MVDALSLYFNEPALLPARHTPPGNIMMTSGAFVRIASAAASAALRPASCVLAKIIKLPPATPSMAPKPSSTMKFPSITGIFQHFLPPTRAFFW